MTVAEFYRRHVEDGRAFLLDHRTPAMRTHGTVHPTDVWLVCIKGHYFRCRDTIGGCVPVDADHQVDQGNASRSPRGMPF